MGVALDVLLVSNRRDFATDYVATELRRRGVRYARVDWDCLGDYSVCIEPERRRLRVTSPGLEVETCSTTRVLFRGPTYLRNASDVSLSPDQQFSRAQGAAFARTLGMLDVGPWMNHPSLVYAAECKIRQLCAAAGVGLRIPKTIVTNSSAEVARAFFAERVVLKTQEPVILRFRDARADDRGFIYTEFVGEPSSLKPEDLANAPVIVQSEIVDKTDVRVTAVGGHLFAAEVLSNSLPVAGDWRRQKEAVQFSPVDIPGSVASSIRDFMANLGLSFGALDFAVSSEGWNFLEVNPTGEWAWLVEQAGLPIDVAIADWLCGADEWGQ